MITNAADYQFVQGITNGEVLIDGGIMPARDVAVQTQSEVPPLMLPRCLRGEDMAFLAECAGERNTVMEQQQAQAHAYTKSIAASQIGGIQAALARYIRPPADAYGNIYIMPDYVFADKRIDAGQYVRPNWDLMSHNFFSLVYPDCGYTSSALAHSPDPFASDDVRAMYWDAQMTARPVPTANAWDLAWPLRPPAGSNVSIASTTQRYLSEHDWSWAKTDTSIAADFDNSGTIYGYGRVGYSYPSGYYVYYRKPTSFGMTVTIPQDIRDWVEDDVTAVAYVLQICQMTDRNGAQTFHDDLYGFPFQKTVNQNGEVMITLADVQHILDTTSANLTERGYMEFGWHGNTIMSNRYNYILGCPLVCKLTDHTDFSALGWNWQPPA